MLRVTGRAGPREGGEGEWVGGYRLAEDVGHGAPVVLDEGGQFLLLARAEAVQVVAVAGEGSLVVLHFPTLLLD